MVDKKYLEESDIIDFSNPSIKELALNLSKNCTTDEQVVKNCFLYVRDEISHSGDIKSNTITCKASDVLKYKTGWCYAKSHLLAALLRVNNIPTALCYQRLSCGEYKDDIFCLHGLNAVYLKKYGWYRIDPRGNKEDIDAQFTPPIEKLAFELQENEFDLLEYYSEPLEVIINTLTKYKSYNEMICHFPITDEYIRKVQIEDIYNLNDLSNSLLAFLFEKDAPQWFIDEISPKAYENRVLSENYEQYVYILDKKIVGLLTIKDKNQIFHLFVDSNYHKKGIAKKLWEFTKSSYVIENMKVNASLYAIKVYESFGFVKQGEEKLFQELKYQPMVYKSFAKRDK